MSIETNVSHEELLAIYGKYMRDKVEEKVKELEKEAIAKMTADLAFFTQEIIGQIHVDPLDDGRHISVTMRMPDYILKSLDR